jgi:NhaA family Na+:H+ antiporter
LDRQLSWFDVLGLGLLGGIGFTVSLLIGDLAYRAHSDRSERVKVAVLTGSLVAATLATVVLRIRNGVYRRIEQSEKVDDDFDGIPDVHRPR